MPKKITKSKIRSSKSVRKNPPSIKNIDPEIIDLVFKETDQMAHSLETWNLKYDPFPDIKKWINSNFILPFGKVIIERYFYMLMDKRSKSFWNILPFSSKEHIRNINHEYSYRAKYYALKNFYKSGQYKVLSPQEFEKRMALHEEKVKEKLKTSQKPPQTYRPIDLDDFDF